LRIAIVSDIHGNLTAFEAVIADLKFTSPDLIFHGGDLANPGSSPAEVVDRIRDLGCEGVAGNADEMLFAPETLEDFAAHSSAPGSLWDAVRETAVWTRAALGEDRIAWLRNLPRVQTHGPMALVHASPESAWRGPEADSSDAELQSVFGPLDHSIAVYGHIHRAFVRSVAGMIVANTGSVSLSFDGDVRAAYLLLDGSEAVVRRVEYDVAKEITALSRLGVPHSEWLGRTLASARPQMP
jgi:predicted phosphodiesterase